MVRLFVRSFVSVVFASFIFSTIFYLIFSSVAKDNLVLLLSIGSSLGISLLILYINSMRDIRMRTETDLRREIQHLHDTKVDMTVLTEVKDSMKMLETTVEKRISSIETVMEARLLPIQNSQKEVHGMIKAIYDDKINEANKRLEELENRKNKKNGNKTS